MQTARDQLATPEALYSRHSGNANKDEDNQQILNANLPRYQNPLQYFDPNTVMNPGGLSERNRFLSRHRVKTDLINFQGASNFLSTFFFLLD